MAKYVSDGQTTYEADVDNLIQAVLGNGVLSGLAVSAQGSPNMTVQLTAGVLQYSGSTTSVGATASLAIAVADPTNPRVDLVHVTSAGVVQVVTGTPAASPNQKPPALPSTSVLLAYVSVAGAAVNIQNSNITPRIITIQQASVQVQPNLVLNSDFARRTVFGLAMPETFADTAGVSASGVACSVAANILTITNANSEPYWCAGSFVWRDGRASAAFKAIATAGIYQLKFRVDANIWVSVKQNNGNFTITKAIAGVDVVQSTTPVALTLNNWYWLEIEAQGQIWTAKIYNTGGTVPGVLKTADTLVSTLAGVNGGQVVAGATISITSDQNSSQWGGIATGNGGVYVETWLPESWADGSFGGTLGGQAIGFDESVDAGPLGKQWAMRVYIPAASRTFELDQNKAIPIGVANGTSQSWTFSGYHKVSGLGGSGALVRWRIYEESSSGSGGSTTDFNDAAETAWTRKSGAVTTTATTRGFQVRMMVNPSSTATGTAYFMLPQLEQGSAATAWRNAPDDGGALEVATLQIADLTTTSAAAVEIDSRDLAIEIFLPWDASVEVNVLGSWANSGANRNVLQISVDGVAFTVVQQSPMVAAAVTPLVARATRAASALRLAAGKHRIALLWATTAGTATLYGATWINTQFTITATRGR